MKTATQSAAGSKTKADSRVIDGLNQLLADSYALMAMSHTAHWNVEGPDFFELHKAFQHHYEELFEAIDEIAERIRALDAFPIGGLARFAQVAAMDEFASERGQKDFVAGLVVGHEKALDDAKRTRHVSGEVDDLETQDLMVKRIQFHQKTLWMLKSVLK
jgi:starvation-inducible DNA-binding protein